MSGYHVGPLTVEGYKAHQAATGESLQVFLDGVNVTHRCRFADNVTGRVELPVRGSRASYGLADRGAGPSDAGRRRTRAALAIGHRARGDPAVSGDFQEWLDGPLSADDVARLFQIPRDRLRSEAATMADPVLDQLYIIRAQVELAIGLLEARAAEGASPPARVGCPHPPDHRHDATNADGPVQWICDLCDQIFPGSAE
jgi:hypothetical protein